MPPTDPTVTWTVTGAACSKRSVNGNVVPGASGSFNPINMMCLPPGISVTGVPVASGTASTGRIFIDATLARFWGPAHVLEAARSRIARARWPGTWLSEAELASLHAPTQGAPYGDAMFVLDPGALFVPSHLGGAVCGMHGYLPHTDAAQSALASSLPLPDDVSSLQDVSSLVLQALGLTGVALANPLRQEVA